MRVTRVRIGSFGGVRGRDLRFDEGLNVVYGPNESGKTTTAEFIRSSLVPSRRRSVYPAKARTDEGSLYYTEDGTEREIRFGSRDAERPRCLSGMDDQLYRSLFAMDARSLDDADAITEGDVKTRFLTVPGGESVPGVIAAAEEDERNSLGLRSSSPSELSRIDSEISSLRAGIAEKREAAESYGAVSDEIAGLRARMSELEARAASEAEARRLRSLYEGNRGNFETLANLKAERASLGRFVEATDADAGRRAGLREEIAAAESVLCEAEARRRELEARLDGADPARVEARGSEIDAMPGRLGAYRRAGAQKEPEPRRTPALIAAGAILIVIGLAAGMFVDAVALALAGIGSVAVLAGVVPRRPAPSSELLESRRFESDLRSLCDDFGVPLTTPEAEVDRLTRMLSASRGLSDDRALLSARARSAEARSALSSFYARFSGEDGFESSLDLTRRASALDRDIAAVECAIRSAGLDPAAPERPEPVVESATGEMREVSARIGALEERRRGILDMDDLESDMDRLSVLTDRRAAVFRSGAVAVLSRTLARTACSASYSEVQPSVVATANRYLGAMTSGGCSIVIDPATDGIVLESGGSARGMGAWSSGLRAQVLLSIKLAIAREMGSGDIPVVLDDVLLPFDSERKAGAMRALADASGDMQILLFTCDSETRDLALAAPGATVTELPRARRGGTGSSYPY